MSKVNYNRKLTKKNVRRILREMRDQDNPYILVTDTRCLTGAFTEDELRSHILEGVVNPDDAIVPDQFPIQILLLGSLTTKSKETTITAEMMHDILLDNVEHLKDDIKMAEKAIRRLEKIRGVVRKIARGK